MSWSRPFEPPIPHPDGGTIRTLRHAGIYILGLSKRESETEHWQLAMEQLINAAEGRHPVMFARIAMLKALNHGKPVPERRRRAKVYKII